MDLTRGKLIDGIENFEDLPEYEKLAMLSRAQSKLNYAVHWSFLQAKISMTDTLTASRSGVDMTMSSNRSIGIDFRQIHTGRRLLKVLSYLSGIVVAPPIIVSGTLCVPRPTSGVFAPGMIHLHASQNIVYV